MPEYNDDADDRYWIDTASEEAIAQLMMDLSTGVGIGRTLRSDFSRIGLTLGATEVPDGPHWPIMVVDEKVGGVIAYAVNMEQASRIAQALDASDGE